MVLNNNNNQGFTLVELVTTLVLIGILAVTVVPRLINVSGYSAYSVRNEIISELRTIQQRALNNSDRCFRVNFDDDGYVIQQATKTVLDCSDNPNYADSIGSRNDWVDDVTVTSKNSQDFYVTFDTFGGIKVSNDCVGECITVTADDSVDIELTTAGYINAN